VRGEEDVTTRTSRRLGGSGFTLLETVIAMVMLAIAALALSSAMASQSRLNSTAREQIAAIDAIRAYIEHMREQYPAAGSTNMAGFLFDTTTPRDFLVTSGVEGSVLRDARGLVLKMTDETGATWGPGAGVASTNWPWTDASMSTVGPIATASTTVPNILELSALGFVEPNTNHLGLDLDGDGKDTTTKASPAKQLLVPCQITLSWLSGSGAAASRRKVTVYATFGPQH
jgi:prepilin-type N-terminal cleavage/methylation domain-containing protein